MKLIILAFIISISLHLLLFNDYQLTKKHELDQKSNNEVKKIKGYFCTNKKDKRKTSKKVIVKKEIISKEKKIQKNTKKRPITKKLAKKTIKVPKKIKFQKKRPFSIPSKEKINAIKNRTLEDFLSQKEPVNKEILSEIEKLYGKEFQTFTKVQKAFIKDNINSFQRITQRVLTRLGYPQLAIKRRLSGQNVVEFLFHPNGDISNLKIINSSGYQVFDRYTLQLIEIAYKDYPKPKTTTKLRFNVRYRYY